MAVLEGYVTGKEFNELLGRTDVSVLEHKKEPDNQLGLGEVWVRLDCNWGIMEFLETICD